MRLLELFHKLPLVKQGKLAPVGKGLCLAQRRTAAATPQKESSALFQGRSLVEQCNFYILFLVAFPPAIQNISTLLFCLHPIVLGVSSILAKPPKESMPAHKSFLEETLLNRQIR